MRLELDPSVDAAYVTVVDRIPDGGVYRTEELDQDRMVDYDADEAILGYEFLNVSRGVDLSDLPHQDQLARLFQHNNVRVLV